VLYVLELKKNLLSISVLEVFVIAQFVLAQSPRQVDTKLA